MLHGIAVGLLSQLLGQGAIPQQQVHLVGDRVGAEEVHQQTVVLVLQHLHHRGGG